MCQSCVHWVTGGGGQVASVPVPAELPCRVLPGLRWASPLNALQEASVPKTEVLPDLVVVVSCISACTGYYIVMEVNSGD